MPPDDDWHAELVDALFRSVSPDATPATGARSPETPDEVFTLDAALFGAVAPQPDPVVPGPTPTVSAALFPPAPVPVHRRVEPTFEDLALTGAAMFTPPAVDLDLTTDDLFGPAPGPTAGVAAWSAAPAPAGSPMGRRERREVARDNGRVRRVSLAAMTGCVVLGLGGLGYAALGAGDDTPAPNPARVEVRGVEVTRATTPSATMSSTTTSSTTTTTATTAPPSTTLPAAVESEPEPEPPATDPTGFVPPATNPPPTVDAPPPSTTEPVPAPTTLAP